ncbi:MAG TPA: CBS domain-containing protein [Steroidobacteraceae bacterium]|nr:CBS domain-containing protein [Steroidobacteraceae bacterium]HEU4532040.1 CBS domain-containing protein [Steroidobacteraceae bacterium]
MNVGEVCQRSVVTVRPLDELLSAARVMRNKHVGYLIAVEPGVKDGSFTPVGVLTDRDMVISVMAREADPRTLRVEDVMTRDLVVAREDDQLGAALAQMRRMGVRRLPVVGERGELVGILSLDDVIETLSGQLRDVAGSIHSEQVVEQVLRS